jgi:hypothetical protein
MKSPRYTIRSLLVVIVIVGLALGVAVLTRENARLQRQLAASRTVQAVFPVRLLESFDAVLMEDGPALLRTPRIELTVDAAHRTGSDSMPNGASAFAETSDGASRKVEK